MRVDLSPFRRISYRGLVFTLAVVAGATAFDFNVRILGTVAALTWALWGFADIAASRMAQAPDGASFSPPEAPTAFWLRQAGDLLLLLGGTFFVGFFVSERGMLDPSSARVLWFGLFALLTAIRFIPVAILGLQSPVHSDRPPGGVGPADE